MTADRCPDDELLIAYAAADLGQADRDHLERHLASCDDCVATVRCIHDRLSRTADPLVAPPAAVARSVQALVGEQPTIRAGRIALPLRLPVLIPTSLAAGFLLMVAAHTWLLPRPAVLERQADIRRATHTATVWSQPSINAAAVSRLAAGQMVEVRGEDAGWCRVALTDRGDGWIECGALE